MNACEGSLSQNPETSTGYPGTKQARHKIAAAVLRGCFFPIQARKFLFGGLLLYEALENKKLSSSSSFQTDFVNVPIPMVLRTLRSLVLAVHLSTVSAHPPFWPCIHTYLGQLPQLESFLIRLFQLMHA